MKNEFLKPRFTGPRFDDSTLPVEVARDLAAYEELVVELAKHLWLTAHPGRRRVPKRFDQDFSLHLEGVVGGGSARPLLVSVVAGALALQGGDGGCFEQARDLIAECVYASAQSQPLPDKFPRNLLDYFNVFGRSLREGESVELPRAGTVGVAALTPERRRALVLAAETVYTKEVELSGTIGETDWEKNTFRLRREDGTAVQGVPLPVPFIELARVAGGKERTMVVVKGIGVFDQWEHLQKVNETYHVEVFPNQALAAQIEALAALEDGWFEGHGRAPEKEQLAWTADQLVGTFPEDLPFPHVAATPDGGLFLEWIEGAWRISAEILLPGHACELQATNTATGVASDAELNLDEADSWAALYAFVRARG
jgi:hypothetical protein